MPVEGGTRAGRWLLESDEVETRVVSPLEARLVSVDYGPRSTEVGSLNDSEMSVVDLPAAPLPVSLQAEWRAEGPEDDISPFARDLQRLAKRNQSLRRQPIVDFAFGSVSLRGIITALRIDYTDSIYDGPQPRHLAFVASLTIRRKRPRRLERSSRFQRETQIRILGAGEDFELLAVRTYGAPELGIVLRRENPQIDVNGEQEGDVVRVFERGHRKLRQSIEPESPALLGDSADLVQTLAETRESWRGPGLVALEEEMGL
mgnify:CR=1 FL=1